MASFPLAKPSAVEFTLTGPNETASSPLPDKLSATMLDVYLTNSTTFLLLLRASGSAWSGAAIGILLLLLAGAAALLLQREHAATAAGYSADEDVPEHQRIKQELEQKSAILSTVNHALNTFLDSGDWSAASRHLLSFALKETHSEFGLLGAVLEGSVLRVLAHDGIHWGEPCDHNLYAVPGVWLL